MRAVRKNSIGLSLPRHHKKNCTNRAETLAKCAGVSLTNNTRHQLIASLKVDLIRDDRLVIVDYTSGERRRFIMAITGYPREIPKELYLIANYRVIITDYPDVLLRELTRERYPPIL